MFVIEPHGRLLIDNRILIINGSGFGINCWVQSDSISIGFVRQGKQLKPSFTLDTPDKTIIAIDKEYTEKIFKDTKSKYGIEMKQMIRIRVNLEVSIAYKIFDNENTNENYNNMQVTLQSLRNFI